MTSTRRDVFKFVGGSAVGALFTPAPWRMITDAALLSESWPGIPRPASGEIRARFNHCALCPAGCAVRARCVGDQPVSLAGVKDHPLSHGALCPWGIAAHHLPYHPVRLRSGPVEEARAAIAEAISHRERVAVLDLRPERTASRTYRRAMAAIPNGVYIAPATSEWGADLSAARTVLSLGAPLVDGWGTPGNVFAARTKFRLIQADAVETRTAGFADTWLPVRPGSEAALAQAVAGEMGAADAARMTGLEESAVRQAIDELHSNGPSLVVARGDMVEAVRANQALDAYGRTLIARRETPVPEDWGKAVEATALDGVPDGSLRVLMIDEGPAGESIPWSTIQPKLANGAVVAAFAWTATGYGRHAQFTLPAPVAGEALDDIPAAVDGVTAVFRLATPWTAAAAGVVDPAGFAAKLAGIAAENTLRERADAIHKTGRGQVFTAADGKTTALKSLSADDFWKALNAGACWMDEKATLPNGRVSDRDVHTKREDSGPLAIVTGESAPPVLFTPLGSKLYRESNLRQAPDGIALAPATARDCGVVEGGRAVLEAGGMRLPVTVAIDAGLPPGVVRVAGDCAATRGKVVRA